MHPTHIRVRAKALSENGNNPKRVSDLIEQEFGVRPSYRTLKDWADKERWKPWRDAVLNIDEDLNPNTWAGVSGIHDPMLHLSEVMAKRLIREDAGTRSNDPRLAITVRALEAVNREYDPGPRVIKYLRPKLMEYITALRKGKKPNRLNEDPQLNRTSQGLLAGLRAQGFPIDEVHAALGMVFTHEQEKEEDD